VYHHQKAKVARTTARRPKTDTNTLEALLAPSGEVVKLI